GIPLAAQRDLFAELPDLGYTDVWSSEVDGADAFTPLVLASAWAPALRLGTAIAPVFTRGPATLAQCAAGLAAAAPGRVAIGIGASSDVIVERWNGTTFDRPLQRVRDTARFLRAALAGARVSERYETFAVDSLRPSLVPDPPPPPPPAPACPPTRRPGCWSRPCARGCCGWPAARAMAPSSTGSPPATAPPSPRTGTPPAPGGSMTAPAAAPAREFPARIFVAAPGDPEQGRALGRRALTAYLNVPVYRAFHEWLGRGGRLAPMWRAWAAGDRRAALAAVPDDVVDDLVVHGPPEACREWLQPYVGAWGGHPRPAPNPG